MRGGVVVASAAALCGVVAAVVAELSAGLLLYATEGFLRALTLILAVSLASLGFGLATAPAPAAAIPGPGEGGWDAARPPRRLITSLRRRWFLALAALAAAAVTSVGWSLGDDPGSTALARGVQLGLLTALPLYALGSVMGALSAVHPRVRVGAWAALGAALGALAQGAVLLVRLEPVSVYLLGVMLVSAAALLQGRALRPEVEAGGDPTERGGEAPPDVAEEVGGDQGESDATGVPEPADPTRP